MCVLAADGGSQGFDTDDGSSFYHIHDNIMYAADGMKMDYGGHDSDFCKLTSEATIHRFYAQ